MHKTALVTGITGQDGSYLAELLLSKGYTVWGLVRKSSTGSNMSNLAAARAIGADGRLLFMHGDMADPDSIYNAVARIEPDEIYNLAAQSFVADSWVTPGYTMKVNAMGFSHLLEAARTVVPEARIYQASTSEMFGDTAKEGVPLDEMSRMVPRSPYGVAKLAAHSMASVYRDSYDMFISCGICFNHECILANTPLLVRINGVINVMTPSELAPLSETRKGKAVQTFNVSGKEIWDGNEWVKIKAITARARRKTDSDHEPLMINTRAGAVGVTAHHTMIAADGERRPAYSLGLDDKLMISDKWPESPERAMHSKHLAKFLGYMVADGYVSEDGSRAQYTKNDPVLRKKVEKLWSGLFGGSINTRKAASGYSGGGEVSQMSLTGVNSVLPWLRELTYAPDGKKRVPVLIMNANEKVRRAFLDAYYAGDGLKEGSGDAFGTNSGRLALGLIYLYGLEGRGSTIYFGRTESGSEYWRINLRRTQGHHGRLAPRKDIVKVAKADETNWVFDIETESGVLMAGVGRVLVANSPRRGPMFLTRKVAKAVAEIDAGLRDHIALGNLEPKRDWGFAVDYVQAMWKMLQHPEPMDYVIATGEAHSVEEFVRAAFGMIGIDNWQDYVKQDPEFMRPAEIYHLEGDYSKIHQELGWSPRVTFQTLVEIMVSSEIVQLDKKGGSIENS